MKNFSSQSLYKFIFQVFKRRLFTRLIRRSSNIFLRGQDFISYGPLLEGIHEEALTNLIKFYSNSINLSDFLIDVGANIGLTSCQNGNDFKKVFCFEPNPLCANILETNLAISLSKENFTIEKFALGEFPGSFNLFIPKHNWGGAFVNSDENEYSEEVLARKDGFSEFNASNYVVKKVKVESAKEVFRNLFSQLAEAKLSKGIVKIDVEGFEKVILNGIADSIPKSTQLMIVFENWDDNLNINELKAIFSRKISIKKLSRTIIGGKQNKIQKILSMMINKDKTKLVDVDQKMLLTGDIIIEIF